jgi:superfamily II DNA/RNA helicase
MHSFSSLSLSEPLQRALRECDFTEPTPIQLAAIPVILQGRDLRASAQTGSGKTAAFALPILQRMLDSPRPSHGTALVLVPTRELAMQVGEEIQVFARYLPTHVKVLTIFGGVSINPQMMALRGSADIIVATPGRLLDLIRHNAVRLDPVSTLVLDEADKLLDMGFAEELSEILALLPERQTLLFSATFPVAVKALADLILNNPERIEIESTPGNDPIIAQRAISVDTAQRGPLLRYLLGTEGWQRVLVFVATQYTTEHLADKLKRNGIIAAAFHGDLSQWARTKALSDFKAARLQVLVATDVAARGIDIEQLPVVVNYDLPRSAVDYVHRIGRTGRAGETGIAVSFVTPATEAHFHLIEKRNNFRLPRETIAGFEITEVVPVNEETSTGTGGSKGKRKSKKDKLREAAKVGETRTDS